MHLVDDEHFVASDLRRYLHLLDEGTDVVDGVVGGGVKFVDVVRTPLVEGHAAFAMVAGFAVLVGGEAVDRLGKDACRGGFSHTARSAEEVGVRQFAGGNGIFEGRGQCALPHHAVEVGGAVFARRDNIVGHK